MFRGIQILPFVSSEQHHKQKFSYGRRKAIREYSIFLVFINQDHIYELYISMFTGENKNNKHKNQAQKTPPHGSIVLSRLWKVRGQFSFDAYDPMSLSPARKPTNHSLRFRYWLSCEELDHLSDYYSSWLKFNRWVRSAASLQPWEWLTSQAVLSLQFMMGSQAPRIRGPRTSPRSVCGFNRTAQAFGRVLSGACPANSCNLHQVTCYPF